jgi:hypothetical protein
MGNFSERHHGLRLSLILKMLEGGDHPEMHPVLSLPSRAMASTRRSPRLRFHQRVVARIVRRCPVNSNLGGRRCRVSFRQRLAGPEPATEEELPAITA